MSKLECINKCRSSKEICQNDNCRHWMDYSGDFNCSIISAENNGPMTLEEIAERLGMSLMHVKNIQDAALIKVKKRILPILNE